MFENMNGAKNVRFTLRHHASETTPHNGAAARREDFKEDNLRKNSIGDLQMSQRCEQRVARETGRVAERHRNGGL